MPKTQVLCTGTNCTNAATSKIAAPWRDGRFSELKTYGYACPSCQEALVAIAKKRPRPSHLGPEETLGEIGVYKLATV